MPRKNPLGRRFERALGYAARIHTKQFRKGTSRPYVGHLLGVASLVITHGGDEDEVIAALLHDAVEDQGGRPRLAEIRRRFGARVARIVEGCTDAYVSPKPPWLARKKKYFEHLRLADSSVRLVSAADKLYNAQETLSDFRVHGSSVWKRFTVGRDLNLWYYREILEILEEKGPKNLVRDLALVIRDLERISTRRK
jgi:(p)ppGpp synthase/HD superfamily hydrolase